jgi:hypothetical protein
MNDDNVVPLPTMLDRLAGKLKGFRVQDSKNREDWIAIQEGICLTLAEARDQFSDNIGFGHWLDDNGLGEDVFNHQTRAAAIAMAREPEALRKCLEATERRSLEAIHRYDFERFTNVRKTTSPKVTLKKPATPKTDKVRGVVREAVVQGKPINRPGIAAAFGVSEQAVQRALMLERGRLEGLREAATAVEPLGKMAPTMQQRYDATVRAAKKQIRDELIVEVREEVHKSFEVVLKHWRERIETADRVMNNFKGIMSRDAFRKIKACLHPDHNTFMHAAEALQTFSELEKVLVKPEHEFKGPRLPATVAELLAMRKTKR